MSRYVEILAIQRPFPFNSDENRRVMFSVNFRALAAAPVEQWDEEIVKVLIDAGASTGLRHPTTNPTGDAFSGPTAILPSTAGPFISLIDTGGTAPLETHNSDRYERLSVQIVVRALDYKAARTRALAVWRALDGLRNQTVAA